ncbi:hypothetical protein F5Y04DRAFT_285636 [Hypomontagnella monticulosa]|nr:hypothetical protein F5Y04DRAFT_285636 [Hypomontagnella monticulosa]
MKSPVPFIILGFSIMIVALPTGSAEIDVADAFKRDGAEIDVADAFKRTEDVIDVADAF